MKVDKTLGDKDCFFQKGYGKNNEEVK